MAANHHEIFTMNASVHTLCNIIRSQGFSNSLKITMKSEIPTATGACFQFRHGVSFSSWGEKITITLTTLSENVTQVAVFSECSMPTQVIDLGKNEQVVRSIYEALGTFVNTSRAQTSTVDAIPVQGSPRQTAQAFCHNCGAPAKANANFCAACGTRLN